MKINKSTLKLYSSPEAVIMQFLNLPGQDRVNNIVKRIMDFSEEEVKEHLSEVIYDFVARHRNIEEVFMDHFRKVSNLFQNDISSISVSRKLLMGAYFTKEYSINAAALFNPSIVPHPSQE